MSDTENRADRVSLDDPKTFKHFCAAAMTLAGLDQLEGKRPRTGRTIVADVARFLGTGPVHYRNGQATMVQSAYRLLWRHKEQREWAAKRGL